jgi:protein-S-isoprenylcysteine O-methyltransferase Ste14
MQKLNFMGAGPKIGGIGLPWLAGAIVISVLYKKTFLFSGHWSKLLLVAGIIIAAAGFIFYLLTARLLLNGLRNTKLITSGTYYCCRNPLYAAFILMIVPGLSLMLNSWLILTASVITYVVFKISIRSEYEEMESFFGEQYRLYAKDTPELIPLPMKKVIQSLK